VDPLAAVFRHFSLSAQVFFCGQLCGMSDDHEADTAGHLHFLRKGCIDVIQPDKHKFRVREPSVLFYPRPMQHRLQTDAEDAEIICARIEFGAGILQPLFQSLPDVIHILLSQPPVWAAESSCYSKKLSASCPAGKQPWIALPNTY
jgi:hypothetical protein